MSEKETPKSKIEQLADKQKDATDCSTNENAITDCRAKEVTYSEEELAEMQVQAGRKADLAHRMAIERCIHCGQKGCWKVTKTEGKTRHLKCKGCANPGKVTTEK